MPGGNDSLSHGFLRTVTLSLPKGLSNINKAEMFRCAQHDNCGKAEMLRQAQHDRAAPEEITSCFIGIFYRHFELVFLLCHFRFVPEFRRNKESILGLDAGSSPA